MQITAIPRIESGSTANTRPLIVISVTKTMDTIPAKNPSRENIKYNPTQIMMEKTSLAYAANLDMRYSLVRGLAVLLNRWMNYACFVAITPEEKATKL
jgi:hypothetical protein